ncbi:AraC family transcriptional regulator [Holophaga foetida]|uniref:AraC family transcriptional regulator n=1 Tax=Holophaga foetida TaxID=35839 RepID=UPI00024720FC|nr:helix-turn-helix domain-containing protein [Holophaga foetida]
MDIQEFETQLHRLTTFEELCREIHFNPDPDRQEKDLAYRNLLESLIGNNPGIPGHIQVRPGFVTLADTTDVSVVRQMRYTPEFRHSHGAIELIYVYEGQCTMRSALGDTTLREGDLCLVSPDTLHAHGVGDDSTVLLYAMIRCSAFDSIFYNLLAHQDIVSTFLIRALYGSEADQTVIFHTLRDLELKQTFLELYFECEQDRPLRGAMLNNLTHRLILLLLRNHEESAEVIQEGSARESAALVPILRHIHAHFRTVTLTDLASRFHVNAPELSSLLKRYTGKTFSESVREIRIHKAARLLENSELSLAAIAESSGYTDASHFHKEFKRFYGMTPGAYRKTHLIV